MSFFHNFEYSGVTIFLFNGQIAVVSDLFSTSPVYLQSGTTICPVYASSSVEKVSRERTGCIQF